MHYKMRKSFIIIISINCHCHAFLRTQTKRTLGEETFQREIMGGLINGIKDNNNDNDDNRNNNNNCDNHEVRADQRYQVVKTH